MSRVSTSHGQGSIVCVLDDPAHSKAILMDRAARLLGSSDHSTPILEIGAGYHPVAPKSAGWQTHVVDHCSQDELRAKYARLGTDVEAIEPVDTIWQGGWLHEAISVSDHGKFRRLIGSHVVEHLPDLAGFLISLQSVLHRDAVVALAIPDRRYCFDYFKPGSTTGDVLEAYATSRSRHSLRTLWNHRAYSVLVDGQGAWAQQPVHEAAFMGDFSEAADLARDMNGDGDRPYLDSHAWQFTPASFTLTILELAAAGIIDWHVDEIYGPEGCEFFAFLKRGAERPLNPINLRDRRMTLLREQLVEQREQVRFALAGGLMPTATRNYQAASEEVYRVEIEELDRKLDSMTKLLERFERQNAQFAHKLEAVTADTQDIRLQLAGALPDIALLGKLLNPARQIWRWLRRNRNSSNART